MESLSRAFSAWLRSSHRLVAEGLSSVRVRRNVLLPGGDRCPFVTVTTLLGAGPERPPCRVVDLWEPGPGAVAIQGARRMSLYLDLVEIWTRDLESSGSGEGPRTLEVRGNLVGRTVGDEGVFEILGNCGRRIRLWTHEWSGARLLVNPYLPMGEAVDMACGLDEILAEPEPGSVPVRVEGGLVTATPDN